MESAPRRGRVFWNLRSMFSFKAETYLSNKFRMDASWCSEGENCSSTIFPSLISWQNCLMGTSLVATSSSAALARTISGLRWLKLTVECWNDFDRLSRTGSTCFKTYKQARKRTLFIWTNRPWHVGSSSFILIRNWMMAEKLSQADWTAALNDSHRVWQAFFSFLAIFFCEFLFERVISLTSSWTFRKMAVFLFELSRSFQRVFSVFCIFFIVARSFKVSVHASASLWQTQWTDINDWILSSAFSLVATPDLSPTMTLAPSDTKLLNQSKLRLCFSMTSRRMLVMVKESAASELARTFSKHKNFTSTFSLPLL